MTVPAEEWIYQVPVDQAVATFSGPNLPATDYSATIDWGDGTTSDGTVSGSGGSYSIMGSHTYTAAPARLTLAVSISDTQGDSGSGSAQAVIDTEDDGSLVPANAYALIDVPFTGVVGTFTDVDTNQVASAFTASVDWGDGGGTAATADITPVTVVSAGIQNDCGQPCEVFNLIGTHTYTRGGGYSLTAYFSKVGDPSIQDIPIFGFAAVVRADGDLSVSTPASISTDATSPAGAPVAYVPPKVSDPDDPTVATASCSPAPGSTFVIGTTTVNCSATDADDLPSAVSSSFTVTVIGPAGQVTALSQTVQSVGTGGSLVATLAGVQSNLAAGQTVAACNMLNAFTHKVSAQSGKSISPSQADTLISEAIQIRAVLSC